MTDQPWVDVATAGTRPASRATRSWWPVAIQTAIAAVLVFGFVAVTGTVAARSVGEREAVTDALAVSDLLARTTLQPALTDAVLSWPPATAAPALTDLDRVVRQHVLSSTVIRVKLWTPEGRVVYSDEPRLIGQSFPLDRNELAALHTRTTVGHISDLSAPENRYERSAGKLLEVYRPVWTPAGQPLLFESYSRYDEVLAGGGRVWPPFAVINIGSLALMHLLYIPLAWALVSRLRRARRQRDLLLASALSASDEERRRIAGTLHDGVVQDLAATSFVVAGSAEQAHTEGQAALATRLETAAAGVRASIAALRSLLVDIYPPNLRTAGLCAALADLASSLRARGIEVEIRADDGLDLEPDVQTLVYQVARECLRNASRHAHATRVSVRIRISGGRVRLEVEDNGVGFDPVATLAEPAEGHFGLRVMRDLAADRGASLAVRSRPAAGTSWRLEVATGAA